MRKFVVISVLLFIITHPAAAVDISAAATQNLNFGTAVLLASSGTVGIRADDGSPIWLRCMNANTSVSPTAGQIELSSPMDEGYETLVIKPDITAASVHMSASNCSLDVKNLTISATSKILTTTDKTQSFNIGGSLEINGYCSSNYEYSGEVTISYSIQLPDTTEVASGMINLPIIFRIENRADVIKDTDMNFGTIYTTGTAGTVTLSPSGIISYISEGLLSSGSTSEGQISIFGAPNMQILDVNYADSIQMCLDGNPNSESCMILDTFVRTPEGSFTLNESRNNQGYKMLHIGGTLHIGEDQPSGQYSGVLSVNISY